MAYAVGSFVCTSCGREYTRQDRSFLASRSRLFAKNNQRMCVCSECVDAMYNWYYKIMDDEEAACRRICMKLDIYWHPEIYLVAKRSLRNNSVIREYIVKSNLFKYSNKTFDDTLVEEENAAKEAERLRQEEIRANTPVGEAPDEEEDPILADNVEFWGDGFSRREYDILNQKYNKWTEDLDEEDLDVGRETLYRQICLLDLTINKNISAGKATETTVNQLNNLLASVNAQPVQKKKDKEAQAAKEAAAIASDPDFDSQPFGVGIRMCENMRPIPKPMPQLEDVDNIVKYITVWFFGHLCKMLHIKNSYSKLYEDEIARLRVERPELEDEDDDTVLESIFEDEIT